MAGRSDSCDALEFCRWNACGSITLPAVERDICPLLRLMPLQYRMVEGLVDHTHLLKRFNSGSTSSDHEDKGKRAIPSMLYVPNWPKRTLYSTETHHLHQNHESWRSGCYVIGVDFAAAGMSPTPTQPSPTTSASSLDLTAESTFQT